MAADTPVKMIEIARATSRCGTRRRHSAGASDQKPPSAKPSATRAANRIQTLDASAASRFDTTSSSTRARTITRRSIRPSPTTTIGPANAPTSAVAVTAWPAVPLDTPSPRAMGVSRLAGRNSAVTSANTPSVSESTAPQAARAGPAPSGRCIVVASA